MTQNMAQSHPPPLQGDGHQLAPASAQGRSYPPAPKAGGEKGQPLALPRFGVHLSHPHSLPPSPEQGLTGVGLQEEESLLEGEVAQLQLALLQLQLGLQHQECSTPLGGGENRPQTSPQQPSLHPQGRAGGRQRGTSSRLSWKAEFMR